jgi:putative transposase
VLLILILHCFYPIMSYMKRTVSIKLDPTTEQSAILDALQAEFSRACNVVVEFSAPVKCSNRVALHHLCYYAVREQVPALGSQMVCNAIANVAQSYKSLVTNEPKLKKEDWPVISFKQTSSVHFDKRTYSFKKESISLFTLEGRIAVPYILGKHQANLLNSGIAKEAELLKRKGQWYFNLVIDITDAAPSTGNGSMGVDVGENNIAATSTGKVFGGGELRHKRDKFLAHRKRLQRNGSNSAKQLLKKISGKEVAHVKHVNHEISKAIIQEAVAVNASEIRLEDLTNIRDNIKAGKRVRSRLHRWSFRQLQDFVAYKAQAVGIEIKYINPAYTSKSCSVCDAIGTRVKHKFSCKNCGHVAHSDVNAASNIAKFGRLFSPSRGAVSRPNVERF